MSKKKTSKPTKKKTSTTTKKTSASKKTVTKKPKTTKKSTKKLTLDELKEPLNDLTKILNQTAFALPSLVSTKGRKIEDMNGYLHDRFKTDSELISMLEGFFKEMVLLLKYRSAYDEKLSQISKLVKKLKDVESLTGFEATLQLLGIVLIETQQIVRNYEEMYNSLFTEQALLQFQLMEQLSMFKEKDVPNFREMYDSGVNIFIELTEKVSKQTE